MEPQTNEMFIAIVAGIALFLLFTGFIIAYVVIYWRRKVRHSQEMKTMVQAFNEELLKTRLEIQEQTFNNISQEIHDNVGQMLSVAKLQLNIMEEKDSIGRQQVRELKDVITHAMTDLRDIAKSLSTERIQSFDLSESVAHLVNRINRTGISASITVDGKEEKIEDQRKLILFRIIQEGLQNAIKHANATRIEVLFNYIEPALHIIISDNGDGFDPTTINKRNGGLGLQNIISRAKLMGGTADIKSCINQGTTITIAIPYA